MRRLFEFFDVQESVVNWFEYDCVLICWSVSSLFDLDENNWVAVQPAVLVLPPPPPTLPLPPLLSSECMLLSQKWIGDELTFIRPYLDRSKLDVVITISSNIPSESLDISNESMSCDLNGKVWRKLRFVCLI